jgi:type IV secretory pathway VirB2 component (pilin)
MNTNFKTGKQGKDSKYTYNIPGRWVTIITQAVTGGITNMVAAVVTVVVTILVLLGGLWLAYVYLPVNIFYIILVVLIIDIAVGIILRGVFFRR